MCDVGRTSPRPGDAAEAPLAEIVDPLPEAEKRPEAGQPVGGFLCHFLLWRGLPFEMAQLPKANRPDRTFRFSKSVPKGPLKARSGRKSGSCVSLVYCHSFRFAVVSCRCFFLYVFFGLYPNPTATPHPNPKATPPGLEAPVEPKEKRRGSLKARWPCAHAAALFVCLLVWLVAGLLAGHDDDGMESLLPTCVLCQGAKRAAELVEALEHPPEAWKAWAFRAWERGCGRCGFPKIKHRSKAVMFRGFDYLLVCEEGAFPHEIPQVWPDKNCTLLHKAPGSCARSWFLGLAFWWESWGNRIERRHFMRRSRQVPSTRWFQLVRSGELNPLFLWANGNLTNPNHRLE